MVEMMKREALASHWWWFDSHNTCKHSPWLQSTLEELDEKTESILKLIEQDADSFAQRAEMYYKKRPELISMVEEFYRAHRSLAEKYDQLKSDSTTCLHTSLEPPLSSAKLYESEKLPYMKNQTYDSYDSYYEACDPEDSVKSYTHDPNCEETIITGKETGEEEALNEASCDEMKKLKEEIKRLEEENRNEKDELMHKDEEIIEVTKQLSFNEVNYYEMMKLKEEVERHEENDQMQKDEVRKLKEEVEGLEEKSKMHKDEMWMLKEEVEKLEEKNKMHKEQLIQKDEENLEVTRQLRFYAVNYEEVRKVKEEIKILVEENRIQEDQLRQKDKEKIEVIRQLSLAVDVLKEDNLKLRSFLVRDSPKKWSPFEFNKLKKTLLWRLFKDTPRYDATIVAL